jgi:alkylation response protein AidB-like acyl-CoA dehydrogenase
MPITDAKLVDRAKDLLAQEVLRVNNQRAKETASRGQAGPGFSIGKLVSGELNQEIFSLCMDLEGAHSMLHEDGYPMQRIDKPPTNGSVGTQFLRSRSNTIEGGTSEIQRNILGERILGLPGDVRVDKELPWAKVPRS